MVSSCWRRRSWEEEGGREGELVCVCQVPSLPTCGWPPTLGSLRADVKLLHGCVGAELFHIWGRKDSGEGGATEVGREGGAVVESGDLDLGHGRA
jgi:hypothetical protein